MRTAMSRRFQLVPVLICLTITVLISFSRTASADTPDCPYPCLPPPSAGAINSYPPPQPFTGGGGFGGSYPPPPPGSYQLTPPGVMPGFSPPYSGGFPSGPAPPPPNPVLPWFPWYYQHTNPITGSTTSASSPAMDGRSTVTVAVLLPLSLLVLLRVL
ncbi:U1 small nuclear ribonucleoprotein C-like [Miscanthus floridulus]|uniref:U1 small nuclear ribonucleoprotein C-like n=1 Tax=Miscanthus floridulus TaxID=154761 RepID=UPI00345A930A